MATEVDLARFFGFHGYSVDQEEVGLFKGVFLSFYFVLVSHDWFIDGFLVRMNAPR